MSLKEIWDIIEWVSGRDRVVKHQLENWIQKFWFIWIIFRNGRGRFYVFPFFFIPFRFSFVSQKKIVISFIVDHEYLPFIYLFKVYKIKKQSQKTLWQDEVSIFWLNRRSWTQLLAWCISVVVVFYGFIFFFNENIRLFDIKRRDKAVATRIRWTRTHIRMHKRKDNITLFFFVKKKRSSSLPLLLVGWLLLFFFFA